MSLTSFCLFLLVLVCVSSYMISAQQVGAMYAYSPSHRSPGLDNFQGPQGLDEISKQVLSRQSLYSIEQQSAWKPGVGDGPAYAEYNRQNMRLQGYKEILNGRGNGASYNIPLAGLDSVGEESVETPTNANTNRNNKRNSNNKKRASRGYRERRSQSRPSVSVNVNVNV